VRYKKSFAQIFLKDKRYLERIINSIDIEIKGRDVLEIGAGRGELSQHLVKKVNRLYCVEIDYRLVEFLKKRFSSSPQVEIIKGDILKLDLSFLNNKRVVVVGNIPFNISNFLIRYIVKNRAFIEKAFFTFQKEFASKLIASPNTKVYGFLSCYIQLFAKVDKLFDIPRTAFSPKPKVDASFVKIVFFPWEALYEVKDPSSLFRLIRKAFSQRRKKLINSLEKFYSKEKLKRAFLSLGFKEDLRAENLSLKDYCRLFNYFH